MIDKENYNEEAMFPPILAVDFDGTLVENKFPEIGAIRETMWNAVKAYQAIGWKIILWTCRTDDMLDDAVKFCKMNGIVPDAVNENLPEVKAVYGGDTRKVFANMYIDDRNAALFGEEGFVPYVLEVSNGVGI